MAEPQQPPGPAHGKEAGGVEWSPGGGPRRGEAAGQRLLEPEAIRAGSRVAGTAP